MGAIMIQQGHPLAYFNKQFPHGIKNGSAYIKKMADVAKSMQKWHHYLLGKHFTIITDHHSLRHRLTQHVQTPEQRQYLHHLLGYDYTIIYRPGRNNNVVDALSHQEDPPDDNKDDTGNQTKLQLMSTPTFNLIDQIKSCGSSDLIYQSMWTSLITDNSTDSALTIQRDLILYNKAIQVLNNDLRKLLFPKLI